MVSKFHWKPFWLATQRDPEIDWTATQNRVNPDIFAQAPLHNGDQSIFRRWGFGLVDKAQRLWSARRFGAASSSPDFSRVFHDMALLSLGLCLELSFNRFSSVCVYRSSCKTEIICGRYSLDCRIAGVGVSGCGSDCWCCSISQAPCPANSVSLSYKHVCPSVKDSSPRMQKTRLAQRRSHAKRHRYSKQEIKKRIR